MLQRGLTDNHCKATHVQLAMIQSALHAYNACSQLISIIKGTFVESPNTRKVMQVRMINPFQLNSIEIQGFTSAKSPAPFRGTGTVV